MDRAGIWSIMEEHEIGQVCDLYYNKPSGGGQDILALLLWGCPVLPF